MENTNYQNLRDKMLTQIVDITKTLNTQRKEIAAPYVHALERKFPSQDANQLIRWADKDLQKSNDYYYKLTQKLEEIQRFVRGPFQELVELASQESRREI
jgi:hypothetical protein